MTSCPHMPGTQDFQWQNQECLGKLEVSHPAEQPGGWRGGPFRELVLVSVPREQHHTPLAQEWQEQTLLWQ